MCHCLECQRRTGAVISNQARFRREHVTFAGKATAWMRTAESGAYWRWKSRKRAGRPKLDRGLRELIQQMSQENPLWGASRIHGELLMLGFEVAQSTVSKYMVRGPRPPSHNWKNVSAQSRRCSCRNRPVRGPNGDV